MPIVAKAVASDSRTDTNIKDSSGNTALILGNWWILKCLILFVFL